MDFQDYDDEFVRIIFMGKESSDYKYLAEEMSQAVLLFTSQLPDDEVFNLKTKLQHTAKLLPDNFADVSKIEGHFAVIRGMIKFNSILDECKDYLVMAQKLKYARSGELINKVDMVGRILNNYLSNKVVSKETYH
jgi:hypothetical protein